jgi:two-component system, sensor histidine kinase and response regulator
MKSICRIAWSVWWLFGAVGHGTAQSAEISRLRAALGTPPIHGTSPHGSSLHDSSLRGDAVRDTAYIDILNKLAYAFYGINSDSAFFYGHTALDYAARTGYLRGEAESWRIMGNTNELVGDYSGMLSCYHHSLDIAEKIGSNDQIAKATSNISLFYEQEGEYDQARQLMVKVMDISRISGDSVLVETIYSHLSDLAFHQHQYDSALDYAGRALQSASTIGNESDIASCQDDLGRVLAALGESRRALALYQQALAYYRQVNDRLGRVTSSILLAQAWLQLKDYPLALGYAQQSLDGARALGRKREIRESAKALADIYENQGDDRKALGYFKLYKDFSDSLLNDQSHKQILALAANNAFEKEAGQLKEQQAEKDARYQERLRKDAVKISITISAIVVLSLLAFILFRSRSINRRNNHVLREKNAQIEEQKETLEQQAVQLLLNNRQKDKLFSIIAHDLRGPLNSLKGLMDFLKEKRMSDEEINAIMNEFRRNVDYSADLVGNLLFWASSQLDGIVVSPVVLPLQPVVKDILALFSHQAAQKHIILKEELNPSVQVIADRDMTQVIIRNLVSNAIKFCRPGDSVTISFTIHSTQIEICVADTGIGLKEDALDRIRRKESFTSYGTAKEKGTGLGMLLCREFTEANHGRFRIESEWEKGCRCYFTLPAAI